ncbi:GHKL domain-containing protein [Desulfohalobiaceae bacterium Ax17]|uniref:sensor histidine kinase n=1 Tax=Desulfovulcanus ferrireducens TaxID=2831190 RepID=UPI00207B9AFA|nr:ATP-binding protein [Desulfovulcanus ferrireducens]MBT8764158.1 GHKL domain-containing protein [Desulfovulcanus ferrireducens]
MKIFRLTLKQKIIIIFIFYTVSQLIIGCLSYINLNKINDKLIFLEKSEEFRNNLLQVRRYEKNFLLYKDDNDFRKTIIYLDNSLNILNNIIPQSKHIHDPLVKLKELIPKYKKIFNDIKAYSSHPTKKSELITDLRSVAQSMLQLTKTITDSEKKELDRIVRNLKLQLIFTGILTILTGMIIFFILFKGVFKTLTTVMDAANMIAHGSFEPIPPLTTYDENQLVIDAFNKMVQELKIHQQQLIQAKKMSSIGILASGIAHQLNNPLNNILTTAQILREELPDIETNFLDRNLSNIESESLRARDIVKGLLEFSRQQEFQLNPTSLNNLIERAKLLAMSEMPSGITIDLKIQEDITLPLDRQRMQEALLNLILNAIQAIEKPPGRIIIRCKKDNINNQAVIEIEDNGKGIPDDVQDKIFDPFFTTKGPSEGTGLGLSIVYNVVKKHGGHLKLRSKLGQGTTFTIYLPL